MAVSAPASDPAMGYSGTLKAPPFMNYLGSVSVLVLLLVRNVHRFNDFLVAFKDRRPFFKTMKTVLVTGANGHVGYNITALLSRSGYKVRAGVRGAGDPAKVKHLRDLGVDIVEMDIMKPDTLQNAMKGVDGVFQVAAVYQLVSKNPEKDVIEPAVVGGLNVLEAAHAAKVKKVVFTSSTAAVGTRAPADRDMDESDWNDSAEEPYLVAKTQAEHKAWDFAEKTGMNLVCINPSGVIGPGFFRHTPTTLMFEMTLRQKIPICVPFGFCYVDVRDVAQAHLLAFEDKKAQGRYIVADGFHKMVDLMKISAELMPGLKVPKHTMPEALMPAALAFDWLGHVLMGAPRQLSRAVIDEYAGSEQRVSSERARRELGWKPMDFRRSLKDTYDWIQKTFIDRKKN